MALLTSTLSSNATNSSTYNPVNSAFTATIPVSGQIDPGFNGSLSGSSYAFSGTLFYSVTGAAGNTLAANVNQLVLTLPGAYGTNLIYGYLGSGSTYNAGTSAATIIVDFNAPFSNTVITLSAGRVAAVVTNDSVIDAPYKLTPGSGTGLGSNQVNFLTVGEFLRRWSLNG
jgi:hypothetical protein